MKGTDSYIFVFDSIELYVQIEKKSTDQHRKSKKLCVRSGKMPCRQDRFAKSKRTTTKFGTENENFIQKYTM